MNKHLLVILCLLTWYNYSVAQQPAGNNNLTGYMCASASSGASTGTLKSSTMNVTRDGGTFEKLENGDSVLKLNRGDFVEFSFTLPESAAGVVATIKYKSENGPVPCFIRWNGSNPKEDDSVTDPPKKNEKLFYKNYKLKDPKRNNVIRVTGEGVEGLKFYNIIVTYNYGKPSKTVDNFSVTLDSPDPAKSILDANEIVFKWSGAGDPKDGYVTLKYRDKNKWKVVPGAEFIDLNEANWKDPKRCEFSWKNHGLTEMPDFSIDFVSGESPIKKADKLFKDGLYQQALYEINAVLDKYPEQFKSKKIKILRAINPFNTECRVLGDTTKIVINNTEFNFVYCPKGKLVFNSNEHQMTKGFWILNQEVSQKQWETIMSSNPSNNHGDNKPVENVAWDDCDKFCKEFFLKCQDNNRNITKNNTKVSLPTEAQWEYACRLSKPLPDNQVHYNTNRLWGAPSTINVTDKIPDNNGIYGMQGNVAEWCLDNVTDTNSSMKVARGGSCYDRIANCQPKSRKEKKSDQKDGYTGFRFVVIPQ